MKEGGLKGEAILFFPVDSSELRAAEGARSGVPDSVVDGSREETLGGREFRDGVDMVAGDGREDGYGEDRFDDGVLCEVSRAGFDVAAPFLRSDADFRFSFSAATSFATSYERGGAMPKPRYPLLADGVDVPGIEVSRFDSREST